MLEYLKSSHRYDPSSIGDSEGSPEMVGFEDWVVDAETVLDTLGSEDNVLVGSSMGGWISLWLASQERLADRISGMVLISPALNFIRPRYSLIYNSLPAEDQEKLDSGEVSTSGIDYYLISPISQVVYIKHDGQGIIYVHNTSISTLY